MSKSRFQRRSALSALIQRLPGPLRDNLRWLRDRLSPEARMRRMLEQRYGPKLLQPWPVTWHDRHPELFGLVRDRLADRSDLRVLSYGCSTGEEAFTLAEYLPRASIDAIDINPRSIAKAERARASAGITTIHFTCASSPPPAAAVYDAVFCLSVLRDGRLDAQRPGDCAEIMPFARFAEAIAALDHALKPGGLLVLWGCNFRFLDTPQAGGYRLIEVPGKRAVQAARYDPDNRLLPISSHAEYVFEKQVGPPAVLRPERSADA